MVTKKDTTKPTQRKAPKKRASSAVSTTKRKTTRRTTRKKPEAEIDPNGLKPSEVATQKKKEAILEALVSNDFHITNACKNVGIDRKTFYNWLNRDQEFADLYLMIQEQDLDNSELTLRRLRDGVPKLDQDGKFIGWKIRPDTLAVMFHLKTKGKKRGYVERQEITGKDGSSLNVTVQVVGANEEDINL